MNETWIHHYFLKPNELRLWLLKTQQSVEEVMAVVYLEQWTLRSLVAVCEEGNRKKTTPLEEK